MNKTELIRRVFQSGSFRITVQLLDEEEDILERYEVLEMEIIVFDAEDVIVTSICDWDGGDICGGDET